MRRRRTCEAFDEELGRDIIDLDNLARMAWNGVPPERRRTVWMLLVGYLPANASRREATVRRKRGEFEEALRLHFHVSPGARSQRDQGTLRQILVDVPRTCPGIPLFAQEGIQNLMIRVLYVWSIRHPASGYVQGMNDLLAIFIMVFAAAAEADLDTVDHATFGRGGFATFDSDLDDDLAPARPAEVGLPPSRRGPRGQPHSHVEGLDASRFSQQTLDEIAADTYWCLSKVLDSIHDHYTHTQPGLRRATTQVEGLLRRVDSDLFKHLMEECMPILQITFRWINCLLTRELPLRVIMRLWDTCLAETSGFEKFFPYVCAAFLCHFSETLRHLQAEDLHLFLQDLPTKDWTDDDVETLLSEAYILSTLFQDAPSHLALKEAQASLAAMIDPLARTG
ncbi:hypothetical protein CTAYLR_008621 [Chrysophaeum taylorii]|uniref:Rab-GAP TBC domain-containing protein n=1 Tax=Chrysophaeum taylorii TaxID=2483200 RepID=A0AAD7XNX7_9STRA|nr:hypothetical protein CTAYLR_008621 [Chrysophaeum taylorii]